MLTKHLQEFDVEKFANELMENLDYVTDEEITQLQYKAQRIKGICKAAGLGCDNSFAGVK